LKLIKTYKPSKRVLLRYLFKYLTVFLICEGFIYLILLPLNSAFYSLDTGDLLLIVPLIIISSLLPIIYFRKRYRALSIFLFLLTEILLIFIYLLWIGFLPIVAIFLSGAVGIPPMIGVLYIFILINVIWSSISYIYRLLEIWAISYKITDKGIFEENRYSKSKYFIPFINIGGIKASQGIFGRLLGINTVIIGGTTTTELHIQLEGILNKDLEELNELILNGIYKLSYTKQEPKK